MASPLTLATTAPARTLPRLLPRLLPTAVIRWPFESQQQARRNALTATTALTQLRHERDEIEEFLDAHGRRWERARQIVEARAAAL